MKKILIAILSLILILSSVCSIYAADTAEEISYEFSDVDVTIIFDGDTTLDETKQAMLANYLAYDITPKETRAWCWLLGHDYVTSTASKIEHKVKTSSPRCLRKTYTVTTCENCDYYAEELKSQTYINCCAE